MSHAAAMRSCGAFAALLWVVGCGDDEMVDCASADAKRCEELGCDTKLGSKVDLARLCLPKPRPAFCLDTGTKTAGVVTYATSPRGTCWSFGDSTLAPAWQPGCEINGTMKSAFDLRSCPAADLPPNVDPADGGTDHGSSRGEDGG